MKIQNCVSDSIFGYLVSVIELNHRSSDKKPGKLFFAATFLNLSNEAILRCYEKKSSNMPRVVWAEESKNGLSFEIGPTT